MVTILRLESLSDSSCSLNGKMTALVFRIVPAQFKKKFKNKLLKGFLELNNLAKVCICSVDKIHLISSCHPKSQYDDRPHRFSNCLQFDDYTTGIYIEKFNKEENVTLKMRCGEEQPQR